MIENNQNNIKYATNRDQINLAINRAVVESFDFTVAGMINKLQLRKPQFLKSAAYGHFGREDEDFGWEKLDMVEPLRQRAMAYQYAGFLR